MPDQLDSAKRKLRACFLGKAGIHGFGVDRKRESLKVYLDPTPHADRQATLKSLREAAEPFPVILVEEQAPRIDG